MSDDRSTQAARVRLFIEIAAAAFCAGAAWRVVTAPGFEVVEFALRALLFLIAVVLTRRYGIALPGKGFASFVLGAILAAILLYGWAFGVLVGAVGLLLGDTLVRRVRLREALGTAAHLTFGTALAGFLYDVMGGGLGTAALTAGNLAPVAATAILYPLLVNGTFYLELTLQGHFDWTDTRLTWRWEAVVYAVSVGMGLGWVSLATARLETGPGVALTMALVLAFGLAYYVISRGVRADELRMVQGLADAVAAEVSIERSFAQIQQLTHHLVPWSHMGFARYDRATNQMHLLADTQLEEKVSFPADQGNTAAAVHSRRPVVSNIDPSDREQLLGMETGGSEILVPLSQGEELVGLWSVRHTEYGMYRVADGELLYLLAPQLALSLILSALVEPMAESSEQTSGYTRDLARASSSIRAAAEDVAGRAARGESEAQRAASRAADAVEAVGRLVDGVRAAMREAESTQRTTRNVSDRALSVRDASAGATERMTQLGSTIGRSAQEVSHLRDASQEVERFAETIAGIANQTNLLALNATIEASRAGVHGRGFAVVADEVRKLAEESAEAARSMGRSAQATRGVLDRAARILEDIASQITDLAEGATRWRNELEAIVKSAEEARSAGERLVEVPRENLASADEAGRILSDARDSASRSATEAGAVAREAAEQRKAVEDLERGARNLVRVAERLQESVAFIRGENGAGPRGDAEPS